MLKLHTIRKHPKSTRRKKIVGRGIGSGKGTYATRGNKGQTKRTGHTKMPARFEGTQPIIRQMPKSRGFKSLNDKAVGVSLQRLSVFKDGDVVSLETLKDKGVVKQTATQVKLLAGKLSAKLTVKVPASAAAKEAIEKAGGKVK